MKTYLDSSFDKKYLNVSLILQACQIGKKMVPIKIKINKEAGDLSLEYGSGERYILSGEYLRIYSPSAEVKGHGKGQEVLQYGKKCVRILTVEPVGNYALKFIFSDTHDSGIYTWDYLYDLAANHSSYWGEYLKLLANAGECREPNARIVKFT